MPRARDPNRDKAHEIWKEQNGDITNRAIAERLGVDEKKVAVWKQRDKWNVVQQTKKGVVQQKKKIPEPVIESDDLTDKQKMFCLYYIKYFNATKAYMKAYDVDRSTAESISYRLMGNVGVRSEIERLKQERFANVLVDAHSVLQKYIDIAFADITDFVEFGTKTETAKEMVGMGDDGPIFEEKEYQFNYVDFKSFDQVDGTIITEVKKGKDGVSVKLADKMKALEFLSKCTDLLSDNDKKLLQEEKLKAEIEKLHKENSTDSKTEDKLKEYFTALGGAFRDNS